MEVDLRAVGGALLIAVALIRSFLERRAIVSRVRVGAGWIKLLTYTRGQIATFAAPLDEILGGAAPELLAEAGISGTNGNSFSAHCSASANLAGARVGSLLRDLSAEIGTLALPEQLSRLDEYAGALTAAQSEDLADARNRARLGLTLRLCGTAGMILLLW